LKKQKKEKKALEKKRKKAIGKITPKKAI